jgi:hypothetical protein
VKINRCIKGDLIWKGVPAEMVHRREAMIGISYR